MNGSEESELLEFSGFSLDPRKRLLFGADGVQVPLSGRPFDTLLYLVEHPNQLVDKQALMKAVWPNSVVEENNLNQKILVVRRALGESSGENLFIVTVPGRGFRFVPAVSRRARTPKPELRPLAVDIGRAGPPPASWRWTLGALVVVVAVGGYFVVHHVRADRAPAPVVVDHRATPAQGPATDVPRASVAVLPFANLTGDAGKEYFSDGMSEELIDALARVPNLRVPARTSSFAYKGRNADIRKIAQDLGVATVLEGSVRSAGDRIKVTVQLVDAKTGYTLFSQTYDREFADIFKLQQELANSIVVALRGDLTAGEPEQAIQAPPTKDVEAYHLYLQAPPSSLLGTEQGFAHAISLLDQALARDPGFTWAWAARAQIRVTFLVFGILHPNALEDSERDARKALSLDSSNSGAYSALGSIEALRGNWIAAEMDYRAAMKASPREPIIPSNYQFFIVQQIGHLRQARVLGDEGFRLAPADAFIAMQTPVAEYLMGHDAEAVKGADFAIALGLTPHLAPFPLLYAFSASRHGHYTEAAGHAVDSLSDGMRASGGAEAVRLAYSALGDATQKPAARDALQRVARKIGAREADRTFLMNLFVMLDGMDQAYELANRSLDESARSGMIGTNWMGLWLPEMRPFRQDPRFQKLVTRLRMLDYWQQYGPPDGCELNVGKLTCH